MRPDGSRFAVHDRSIAKSAHQTQEFAVQSPDQMPNGFRLPCLLPLSASGRCYPGNLGSNHVDPANLSYFVDTKEKTITFRAYTTIQKGEQMTIDFSARDRRSQAGDDR